jgi:hypothetical protein
MHKNHINSTPTLSITVHIVSVIFPHFQTIFAWITIFRNVHSPHQHYPNTINNSLDMSILFFLIFHNFSAIFILITIFGKVHRPCKQSPTLSPIVMISTILPTTHCMDTATPNHHNLVFLNFLVIYFFLIFWLQCVSYHIWKCAQTM